MIASLYIDGRKVGALVYEHPVDNGKTIHIPTESNDFESEAVIAITDGDGNVWIGKTKLKRESAR